MRWRIYYNHCFYSDIVAESEREAKEKVESVLNLEELFHVDQAEMIREEKSSNIEEKK